jgi:hypothetical protein
MEYSKNKTTEFSFMLKPAEYGVGVFATHDIKKGTFLRLFGDSKSPSDNCRELRDEDVPKLFWSYCPSRGGTMMGPSDFGRMEVGWYLNHSKIPNARHENYNYYALRDIKAGEEIAIDYNSLEQPEEDKQDFYK